MVREGIAAFFIVFGFVLMLISAIGVLRFKDFLSRLHATSVGESMGIVMMCIGFVIKIGLNLVSAKIILIVLAIFIVNPVGTHLIGKSALRSFGLGGALSDDERMNLSREKMRQEEPREGTN